MLQMPTEDVVQRPSASVTNAVADPALTCRKCLQRMHFAARHVVGPNDAHSVAVYECDTCGRLQAIDETAIQQH